MLSTKILTVYDYEWELSEKISQWINTHQDTEVVDIKFSTAYNDRKGSIQYSAMIIYKKEMAQK